MRIKQIVFPNGRLYDGNFVRQHDMIIGVATDMTTGKQKMHYLRPVDVVIPFTSVELLIVDPPVVVSKGN